MSLLKQIEKDYITAYKAKLADKVAVLRMVKAAIKMQQVELGRELTDDEIQAVLNKQVKQRKDSIAQFTQAGRQDLADKEQLELTLLEEYLPTPLSSQELSSIVQDTVQELGATSLADMGKVMQSIMGKYSGRVDGKELSSLVRNTLSA